MSLKNKIKIKKRKVKPRNHLVVVAKFRNSAGAIKDHKKENDKDLCREKVYNEEE
jgi:hypothetical protein